RNAAGGGSAGDGAGCDGSCGERARRAAEFGNGHQAAVDTAGLGRERRGLQAGGGEVEYSSEFAAAPGEDTRTAGNTEVEDGEPRALQKAEPDATENDNGDGGACERGVGAEYASGD